MTHASCIGLALFATCLSSTGCVREMILGTNGSLSTGQAGQSGGGTGGGIAAAGASGNTTGNGGAATAGAGGSGGASCPAEVPRFPVTSPDLATPCGPEWVGAPCTYATTSSDGAPCTRTFECRCLRDTSGTCYWAQTSLECCDAAAATPCAAAGLQCLACPTGPVSVEYYCSTPCAVDADCTDPVRPKCSSGASRGGLCLPAAQPGCAWDVRCASPDTPIATPTGDRPIASLREGDLVYSVDDDEVVAVPIVRVARVAAPRHFVARIGLRGGAMLEMSVAHPTSDGRLFADLAPGHRLGGAEIVSVQLVPYRFAFTHDILPASSTGTYFAAGALVGSTLAPAGVGAPEHRP